ncbi:dipeptide transport system permease protein DppC [Collibacillus ludicampi]|jgi:oligopeptide transport system permease protein|uniref:Dipeptide transport system permease protein DppC n=1 Tax=Collibacillus ludicampi TaxID=2771369 RepID=A0AAV4LH20_9BACL|nr:ABC transporter permease [Collibacillus ludicampi]GIM47117.1 dipeptide transport system permease protein DppC [Collibacillus ludicampi]
MELMTNDSFTPVPRASFEKERIVRPSLTYWQDAWRRLKKNKLAMLGLVMLIFLTVMAIIGPFLQKYGYDVQDLSVRNQAPSAQHWFGTDDFGRDLWVRVWWGTRISLFIGIMAALMDFFIGVLYGGISAYYGGKVDDVMQRFIEIVYAIPYLLITVLLIMVMGSGIWTIVLAYGVTGWIAMARLVRGQVLSLKEQEYVLAARTLGASPWRIITRHLIPNALGFIVVQVTFTIPQAIFTEAFLSFLGLGVKVPLASLGMLLSDGVGSMRSFPWRLIFPSIVFSLMMLSFNLLGDGLRDALDPKLRK